MTDIESDIERIDFTADGVLKEDEAEAWDRIKEHIERQHRQINHLQGVIRAAANNALLMLGDDQ